MAYLYNYTVSNDLSNIKDDQLANHWILIFDDFPNFDFYVEEHNLPLWNTKTERIDKLGIVIPDGIEDYRTYSITFRETRDFQGLIYHRQWLFDIYDFEKRVVKKGYHSKKRNATIKFFSPKADTVTDTELVRVNAEFVLKNMQITGIEEVQLNETDGEPLKFTVQYEIEQIKSVLYNKDAQHYL